MAAGQNYDCASATALTGKDCCAPVLNPEKHNTEDTKNHREPQRNPPVSPRRLFRVFSTKPSVLSVAFLRVLCVKFR